MFIFAKGSLKCLFSFSNLHKSFLKKGFIPKNKKIWTDIVRQIITVHGVINSSLAKRCELKSGEISSLSLLINQNKLDLRGCLKCL